MTTFAALTLLVCGVELPAAQADSARTAQIEVRAVVGSLEIALPLHFSANLLRVDTENEQITTADVWDGTGVSPRGFVMREGMPAYQGSDRFTLLAQPSLIMVAGEEGAITIGGGGTEFLEPVPGEEGLFRAAHVDEGPSISLECAVTPNADGTMNVRFELEIVRVGKRDAVEGLTLNVGRPSFAKSSIDGDVSLAPGHWLVQQLFVTKESPESVVFLLQATPHVPDKD